MAAPLMTVPADVLAPDPARGRSAASITFILLQISHRLAAVGLLAAVAAAAAIYLDHDPAKPVMAIAGTAAVGLSAAILGRSQRPRAATAVVLALVGLIVAAVLIEQSHALSAVVAAVAGSAAAVGVFVGTDEATDRTAWREATGAIACNLVLLSIALTLMLYGRRDPIRDDVQSVLAPTPALPAQAQ